MNDISGSSISKPTTKIKIEDMASAPPASKTPLLRLIPPMIPNAPPATIRASAIQPNHRFAPTSKSNNEILTRYRYRFRLEEIAMPRRFDVCVIVHQGKAILMNAMMPPAILT